jgi:hypothetical protein
MRTSIEPAVTDAVEVPTLEWPVLNNGLTPYLWARLRLTDRSLTLRVRRTLLGVVPVGVVQRTWAVHDIRDIRVTSWAHVDRLVVFVAMLLLLLLGDLTGGWRIATIVVAIAYVPLSLVAVLRIAAADSSVTRVPLCLLHIGRGRRIAAAVRAAAERVPS